MWIETIANQWVRSDTIEEIRLDKNSTLCALCRNGHIHGFAQESTENGLKLFIQIISHSSSVMVYQDDIIQGEIGFKS